MRRLTDGRMKRRLLDTESFLSEAERGIIPSEKRWPVECIGLHGCAYSQGAPVGAECGNCAVVLKHCIDDFRICELCVGERNEA